MFQALPVVKGASEEEVTLAQKSYGKGVHFTTVVVVWYLKQYINT